MKKMKLQLLRMIIPDAEDEAPDLSRGEPIQPMGEGSQQGYVDLAGVDLQALGRGSSSD